MVAQCENVRVSESVSDAHKIELENLENEENQGHSPCTPPVTKRTVPRSGKGEGSRIYTT